MVGNIVRSGSGRTKGCQSSVGRTFVLSRSQKLHQRLAAPLTEQWHRPDAAIFYQNLTIALLGIGRFSITSGCLNSLTTAALIGALLPELTCSPSRRWWGGPVVVL